MMDGENYANGRGFHNKTERFITVHTYNLRLVITYKTNFVMLKTTIKFLCMPKNLHTVNDINITRSQNQIPHINFI